MSTIAITGASGYIGQVLVAELARLGAHRLKVLSRPRRRNPDAPEFAASVEIVEGDLREPKSLQGFLEPGCAVINLAYLWDGGESGNLEVNRNLLDACSVNQIGRLIHCSTAVVAGRANSDRITEQAWSDPVTEYGITKLKIEQAILAHPGGFDSVILRPTAVLGAGGENLRKLAGDLSRGSRLLNYLKSCLLNKRRMNLVHVGNVVAAIRFLIDRRERFGGEVLIVSDADHPDNNFRDVERILMRELGIPDYRLPRLPLPPGLLALLLARLGKDNTNPRSDYWPAKLLSLGFNRPVGFEQGLVEYAAWYRASHDGGQSPIQDT